MSSLSLSPVVVGFENLALVASSAVLPDRRPRRKTRAHEYNKTLTNETRAYIVNLQVNNGMTGPEIVRQLDNKYPLPTIYSVLRAFRTEGRIVKKYKGGRKSKYREDDRNMLVEIQDNNATITYRQLREEWKDATGNYEKPLSNHTIYNILKQHKFRTKMVYREPPERNTPENIANRKLYSEWAVRVDENDIIFIDEQGFDLHTRRRRGRARIGIQATAIVPCSQGAHISVLAALSPVRGIVLWEKKLGFYNMEEYADFIRRLLREPALQVRSHTIIQDNAKIHKGQIVKDVYEEMKVLHEHKFLPPYSPHLNPIENCFSKWKWYVKTNAVNNTTGLLALIDQAAATITAQDAQGWYRSVIRYYVHCAAGNPLVHIH